MKKLKNTINVNYFKDLDSAEKCYWLGYITADGSINKNRSKLSFCIKSTDIKILSLFKKAIDTTNKLAIYHKYDKRTKKTYRSAGLQVTSKLFVQNLCTTGVDENKSKYFDFSKIPIQYINDFVRGLLDGDGAIMLKNLKIISTSEFIEFLKTHYSDIKFNHKYQIFENVWAVYIYRDRVKFLDRIYNNDKVCIPRKKVEYLKCKKYYENSVLYTDKIVEVEAYKEGRLIGKYSSIKECAEKLDLIASCIVNTIAGRHKTHKGHTFKKGKSFIVKHLKNGETIKYEKTSTSK